MTALDRIDAARERWNVLEHPFYVRWSNGELTSGELAHYAGQYRHVVVALAEASERAAAAAPSELRPGLEAHAREEVEHVELWDRFLEATGGSAAAEPAAETRACAEAWAGSPDRDLARSLVALYAIEAGQPAISRTKVSGLLEHYGFATGPATAYFDLHATLDAEHAQAARTLIEERGDQADADALVAEAEAVLEGNWRLLDGVEGR